MRNVIKNSDDEVFKAIVQKSNSIREVIAAFNLNVCGAQYDSVKAKMATLGLSTDRFDKTQYSKSAQNSVRIPLSVILIDNSSYSNFTRLKIRLVKEGLLKYRCNICSLTDWLGSKISLQLDHINGNDRDHRIENLRLLCPNCHSQTSNYAGRNKRL